VSASSSAARCIFTGPRGGIVTEWAGHSVAVLLRVYAKCIVGQQADAIRRILDAQPEDTSDGPPDHQLKDAKPETPDDDAEESQWAGCPG
jgi:hypothetical protein